MPLGLKQQVRGIHIRGPGRTTFEAAAEGTGPGGACEKRPVRRRKGQRQPRASRERGWPPPRAFPLQGSPGSPRSQNSTHGALHPHSAEPGVGAPQGCYAFLCPPLPHSTAWPHSLTHCHKALDPGGVLQGLSIISPAGSLAWRRRWWRTAREGGHPLDTGMAWRGVAGGPVCPALLGQWRGGGGGAGLMTSPLPSTSEHPAGPGAESRSGGRGGMEGAEAVASLGLRQVHLPTIFSKHLP